MKVASIAAARERRDAKAPIGYAPGVTPFDPTNPAHVQAWNTLHQLGWAEAKNTE